jgi:histidinol dehydrogenase
MSFNTIIDWNTCTEEQQRDLLMRPAISASRASPAPWRRS